jgi:DNA invertase Pin-like site-specific DNA recombinase
MLVGYARVSTQEQDLALQLDALRGAGCRKVFEEKASGAQRERPALKAALDYMRASDTLVVWKLDRLARSLKQLIETVEDLVHPALRKRSPAAERDLPLSIFRTLPILLVGVL